MNMKKFVQNRAYVARYSREMVKMRAIAKIHAKEQKSGSEPGNRTISKQKVGRSSLKGGVADLLKSLSNHAPRV